jgi:NAD(P)H-dependent FMN reductase
MKSDINVAVIYGSYRSNRQGIKAAKFAVEQLNMRCEAGLLDAKEVNLPMLDKMYKEYEKGEAPKAMEQTAERLRNSDAFVVVTGEYNHGIPAGLKNLLDHFQKEYFFKPAGILSYSGGNFGGVRSAVHMRAVLGELGMPTISTMLPVPYVGKAFEADNTASDPKMVDRFKKFADELLWYAVALKGARNAGTPF